MRCVKSEIADILGSAKALRLWRAWSSEDLELEEENEAGEVGRALQTKWKSLYFIQRAMGHHGRV